MEPSDRRPKAASGDLDAKLLFQSVGLALTGWETLEMELAQLFMAVLGADERAGFFLYRAAQGSSSRSRLLRALVPVRTADPTINDDVAAFIGLVEQYRARRNEIAHGIVVNLGEFGHYLGPSTLDAKKWDGNGAAVYQYVAADIVHYALQFHQLAQQCTDLVGRSKASPLNVPSDHLVDRRD